MQCVDEAMKKIGDNLCDKSAHLSACGIGPELSGFVDAFIKSPDHYLALTIEERRKIENQLDAIIASIG